jgi:hypothetical protein
MVVKRYHLTSRLQEEWLGDNVRRRCVYVVSLVPENPSSTSSQYVISDLSDTLRDLPVKGNSSREFIESLGHEMDGGYRTLVAKETKVSYPI